LPKPTNDKPGYRLATNPALIDAANLYAFLKAAMP
jgi:hypothetical protein